MSIWEAIILGIVQGLAEFLPVSSSGHLQIVKNVLGVQLTDNLTFDVMLHVATVLATVVVLWREVEGLLRGVLRFKMNAETVYFGKLLLSMIPIGVVGFLLRDQLNDMLSSRYILLIVSVMLLLTAALLLFAGRAKERSKNDISWLDAFIIGVAQAAAAMPGLSRSGSTIAAGLMLGNRKAAVAQFSFLMVIAPIVGEALLDVVRGEFGVGMGVGMWPLMAGFVSAFAVGCVACKIMIELVKRSKLVWFSAYCAVVGLATMIYWWV